MLLTRLFLFIYLCINFIYAFLFTVPLMTRSSLSTVKPAFLAFLRAVKIYFFLFILTKTLFPCCSVEEATWKEAASAHEEAKQQGALCCCPCCACRYCRCCVCRCFCWETCCGNRCWHRDCCCICLSICCRCFCCRRGVHLSASLCCIGSRSSQRQRHKPRGQALT